MDYERLKICGLCHHRMQNRGQLAGSFDFHKTDKEADFVIVDHSKHPAYLEKGRYCHDEAILAFRQVSKFWQVQVNPKCVRSTTKLGMLIEYVRGT